MPALVTSSLARSRRSAAHCTLQAQRWRNHILHHGDPAQSWADLSLNTWLASQISPSVLSLMALGRYQYVLLDFPSFTLLQILPSSVIPSILLNFTPQTWLLTPNTAADSSGVQHTPASRAGVPAAHTEFCLFTPRSQFLEQFLCLGNLPMSSAQAFCRDSQNLPLHKPWRNISKAPSKESLCLHALGYFPISLQRYTTPGSVPSQKQRPEMPAVTEYPANPSSFSTGG